MRPLFLFVLSLMVLTGLGACDNEHPTLEKDYGPRLTTVALGSCNVQLLPQSYWARIASDNPDLFIFGGDNVYGDLNIVDGKVQSGVGRPELLTAAYKAQADSPEFQAFRDAVPIYPVWDDHDFGEDDAGASYAHKDDSEEQFLDFWNIPPDDVRRQRPGTYTSSIHGPVGERVQIILLDTRYFRSDLIKDPAKPWLKAPSDDLAATMLGDAQWTWLEAELKREADVRLIVSSVQVHAQGHRFERWGNFPHELERLYTLIDQTRANGVVFLSGDRHSAALYAKRRRDRYPIFEMTSSSLNSPTDYPSSGESGPSQLGSLYDKENYAIIEFDWEARAVVLRIKDMTGKAVRTAGLEIDELR